MGIVYKAFDTKLERIVAIKVLPAWVMAHPPSKRRFEREAKLASALSHPNIVTVYGFEECNGVPFIVMEYVEGQTLSELIPKEGMTLRETLGYARKLAPRWLRPMATESFTAISSLRMSW